MSCCGGKRRQFYQPLAAPPAAAPVTGGAALRPLQELTAAFEYFGPTGLTATGPITRQRYRFDRPGATVQVDARDAPAFDGIPHLRRSPR